MAEESTGQELLSPEEQKRIAKAAEMAERIAQQAAEVQVRTGAEAQAAADLLTTFATDRRSIEEARTFIVKPLNEHVKAINARFKPHAEALAAAERVVKDKVLGFQAEEERRAREEQARLDAERAARERAAEDERRRVEAEARAEREAAAREAAKAEAEAREADRLRREQLDADAQARRTRIAKLDDEPLRRIAEGGSSDAPMAQEELAQRQRAREAQERAAAARQAEDEARQREEAAREAPAEEIPQTVAQTSGPLAGLMGRKRWVAEVVDESRVPRKYLVVDQRLINAAVRDGVREIAGVKIEQRGELATRSR